MRVAAHDFEHVVLLGIDVSGVHRRGAFRQRLHHLLLVGGGLDGNGFIAGFGRGQMKLIGGLDVRNLLEQRNEFREIEESRKSRAGTVAGALRGQLDGRDRFPEDGSPGVEVRESIALERAVLQVTLHGVHLRHAVGDRGPRGKDDALAAGKLIHIAAFGEHVGGLLRVRGGKPRHIAHLGEKEQW